jgi:hypothetical protein
VPAFSIVALGSVLSGKFDRQRALIGGNPARFIRELDDADLFLIVRKTRNDIPDVMALALLPPELRAMVETPTEPAAIADRL